MRKMIGILQGGEIFFIKNAHVVVHERFGRQILQGLSGSIERHQNGNNQRNQCFHERMI